MMFRLLNESVEKNRTKSTVFLGYWCLLLTVVGIHCHFNVGKFAVLFVVRLSADILHFSQTVNEKNHIHTHTNHIVIHYTHRRYPIVLLFGANGVSGSIPFFVWIYRFRTLRIKSVCSHRQFYL